MRLVLQLLMHVAPQPSLVGLRGSNHRMARSLKMLGCMAVLRRVAASYMAACQAGAQMHPFISHRHALRAHMDLGCDVMAVGEMFAKRHGFQGIVA